MHTRTPAAAVAATRLCVVIEDKSAISHSTGASRARCSRSRSRFLTRSLFAATSPALLTETIAVFPPPAPPIFSRRPTFSRAKP